MAKKKLSPTTAPFKPGSRPFKVREAKAKAAQEGSAYWSLVQHGLAPPLGREPNVEPKQTGSAAGLADAGHPFQGVTKGGLPSKSKSGPNETDQVALARARKQRLQHGGLLTAPQRAAERKASEAVPTKTKFATPPAPTPTRPSAPVAGTKPTHAPTNGREAMQQAAPRGGGIGLPSVSDILGGATHAASVGAGTALAGVGAIPSTFYTAPHPALAGAPSTAIEKVKPTGLPEAASGIKKGYGEALSAVQKGASVPTEIPGGVEVAQADLTPGARKRLAAQGVTGPVSLKTLLDQYGEGSLGPHFRKKLIDRAVDKQGWPAADAKHWTDADAAARAFNPYSHTPFGFAQNFAADIGGLMASAQIVPMVGAGVWEAAHGNTQPLVRTSAELLQQWKDHLAVIGNKPLLENFYEAPITTFTSNAPVAKFAGLRVGKLAGLEETRDVRLPSTSTPERPHIVKVPTTQNALTRPLTKIPDALLARSAHPAVRAQGRPPSGLNEELGAGLVSRTAQRAGHAVEKRYATKAAEHQTHIATLQKGTAARLAQEKYLRAVRDLPTHATDLLGRARKVESDGHGRKVSGKQQRAEAIVYHAGIGMSSPEAVRFYEGELSRTEAATGKAQAALEDARTRERDAVQAGDEGGAETARKDVSDAREEIDRLDKVADQQRDAAEYSRKNPVDIHSLHPKEQALVNAAREVSQSATRLQQETGALGEQGVLYGDLQHNLEIEASVNPDTQAGKMARVALSHRDVIDALEEQMKGGKLADRRSPAAQQALGRTKVLADTLKDVRGRRQAVRDRLARKVDPGAADAAAEKAGVARGTLHRIRQEGRSALTAKRERVARRVRSETRIADEMEASQRQAHEKVSSADITRAKRKLLEAQNRTNSPIERIAKRATGEVEAAQRELDALQRVHDHGFTPDNRLLAQRATVARLEAEHASVSLTDSQANAIAQRHISTAQRKAIGDVALHDAMHEGQFTGADRELGRLEARTQALHDEHAAKFEDISGSKADAAIRHEEHSRAFVTAMEEFQKHQHEREIDPFHITLHRPGDRTGSARTDKTKYTQFPEGNYTRDIHIQLSADLEAHARAAVEAELFRRVSESPYVISDPPANSRVPPGFILTDREALKTPRKPEFGPDGNKDLIDSWQQETRAPSQYVPDDGKPYALVSKDMHDWLSSYVRGNQIDLGRFQAALKFTNAYRRWMLFSLPRTLVNNAVGNPILAAMGGAGIMDYLRAVHLLRQHPDLIPISMRHAGPIANVLETQKLTGYQNFWRSANVFHEDLGRLTVYMHHVVRAAKQDQGLRFYNRIDMASAEMTKFLKNMAEGKNPDVIKFTDFSTRWFGNMAKKGKWDPVLSTAFLFHRWVGHMIHLTLWTMPVHYPGRTAFLLNLSQMADDYRKEHGNLPDWAKSIVGIWQTVDKVAGLPQKVIWGMNTGGVNPFATPGQTLDFGSTANVKLPFASIAAANVNPFIRILLEQGFGARLDTLQPFTDTYGRAIGPGGSGALLLNQLIANTPILSTLFPRTGLADNAIQFDPNAPRRYSAAGLRNPEYYPPTPLGHGRWLDWAERALAAVGVSIRPVDSTGPRTKLSAQKAVNAIYQQAAHDSQTVKAAHAAAARRISQQARKPTP